MNVFLRPINEDDGKLIVRWRNNPKVAMHCFNRTPVTEESHRKFYEEQVKTGNYKQFIVEKIEESSGVCFYPIATVYLKDIDRTNKRCQLCIFTSDDEEWNTECQMIAINKLLMIAFEELGMHKVYSFVFTRYSDEKELLENAGLTVETVMKSEAIGSEGEFEDAYRMVIFEDEYRRKNQSYE
ncbi:Protein N-acetyltransferase, RimJ/RimL family [Butyrivibrio sp. INlla18]|uniref:GNAT family N-acetyltransferase n=1 Tax=Butyrivibrio sp. INlla18 TaxID=1520806 RepID=UPI00088EC5A1|nr:GNAT family N-acetyltransferase [Butyrivibrio sp. INlla18]SDA79146.1 Protein N-acetyltransferase, RimJ/RimL family [Butyrivibrio sp. INlla18]